MKRKTHFKLHTEDATTLRIIVAAIAFGIWCLFLTGCGGAP